ncbi:MAG: hypothetical protein DCF19_14490 [Pseudanabaena frigida]|uniref:Uncharacterized protein n=1 Tax=Pseudanabaena frigida TaxID=945775 RepID=A0A2W4W4B6_9CYAN|nr:MAG: hypothetical protein DCF19_14490 [Pseudanabaena frigida]
MIASNIPKLAKLRTKRIVKYLCRNAKRYFLQRKQRLMSFWFILAITTKSLRLRGCCVFCFSPAYPFSPHQERRTFH